jgi:thiosulfate/3-mercaptopyruvate sulfurtransferase
VDNRRVLVDVPTLARDLAEAAGQPGGAGRGQPGEGPPAVLDVRWSLSGGADRAAYHAGHLPGAVFVDLDEAFTAPPGPGGRHPLPDPKALESALRQAGVRAGQPVVVYEAGGGPPVGSAARAWWVLRWAGLADVRVLDGGYAAWVAVGQPVTRETPVPEPGDVTVQPGFMRTLDADGAVAVADGGVLIDARVGPRFRGETEPIDPVAGHIPGAVNQPIAGIVDDTGRYLPEDALRERFTELGVTADRPVGAYCGSGITAAQTALALTVAGFDPALYVGSWSNWIADRNREVATGG